MMSKSEREIAIKPIIQKLKKFKYEDDKKLQALMQIINYHSATEKIVIFCDFTQLFFI